MSTLQIEQVSVHIHRRAILNKVSFEIALGGNLVGILGPNGAGKSTLFNCITGFDRSYQGEIKLNQLGLNSDAPSHRTAKGLGYLPQESWLFLDLTVEQNLTLFGELQGLKGKELKNCVNSALEEMKISRLHKSKATQLSGGEKRRLEFARTLMFSPQILLLDEPFTGIDPKTVEEITQIILSLKDKGISIFISDHQAETILKMVEKVYILYNGTVLQSGPPEQIRLNKEVQDIYLGSQTT